jgi:hypothetical protein
VKKIVLFLFIFLLSCSKVSYQKQLDKNVEVLSSKQKISFEKNIEIMLMFLWPKDLNLSQLKVVESIIKKSQKLYISKKVYLNLKKKLSIQYQEKGCDCHLYFECDDDTNPEDDQILLCEKIEEDISKNESKISFFYKTYEWIVENLKKIGGDFFSVGIEDDIVDIGFIEQDKKMIFLNKVVWNSKVEKNIIIHYNQKEDMNLFLDLEFDLFDFHFKSRVDISDSSFNTVFQGNLETTRGQKGLIYWEHLK